MAQQQFPGIGLWIPVPSGSNLLTATTAITTAGMKVFQAGYITYSSRSGTKNIATVSFRTGALTVAGGSTIRVSIQNYSVVNAAAPAQPDGTILQSVSFNINTLTASAWNTVTLGAVQSVSYGQRIGVVIEMTTLLGADSLVLNILPYEFSSMEGTAEVSYYNNSTWATLLGIPNIKLGFDDSTVGAFDLSAIVLFTSAVGSHAYTSGSNPNEYALAFQVPVPCKIDAIYAVLAASLMTANFTAAIYDGTTVLDSDTVDAHTLTSGASSRVTLFNFGAEVSLLANHTYYISILATGAGSVTFFYFDVPANADLAPMAFGINGYEANRHGGAWTTVTTRRPMAGIRVSSLDDGTGGGGSGMLFQPDLQAT